MPSPKKDMNPAISPFFNSHPVATDSVICTADLEVTYKNKLKALKITSLDITQGSFVVLLGTSSAGKSTLLRALNGLVKPPAGSVYVFGAVPLTTESLNLNDHVQLISSKPGQLLISVARGSVVNEQAGAETLESGRLAGEASEF